MWNYFHFRTLYAEHVLLVIHAQTLQYFFLCVTTLRTHITSHTLLFYILKYMYINSSIIVGKFVVFTYNYVKKKSRILRTNTALFKLCIHNDVLILYGLLLHFVQNPN